MHDQIRQCLVADTAFCHKFPFLMNLGLTRKEEFFGMYVVCSYFFFFFLKNNTLCMLPFSHRVCPLYTFNFVIVGTRIIIIIIIIISQKHNAERKERQGKRYAAEKAGATPKRTKEESIFWKDVSSFASSHLCFIWRITGSYLVLFAVKEMYQTYIPRSVLCDLLDTTAVALLTYTLTHNIFSQARWTYKLVSFTFRKNIWTIQLEMIQVVNCLQVVIRYMLVIE